MFVTYFRTDTKHVPVTWQQIIAKYGGSLKSEKERASWVHNIDIPQESVSAFMKEWESRVK